MTDKIKPDEYALLSSAINTSGQIYAIDVSDCCNIVIAMNTSSLVGHNCTFEHSIDGANWYPNFAVRSNAATIESTTGALSATPTYTWEASVNGINFFRIRNTAHTSGSATWSIQKCAFASEPNPAVQIAGSVPVNTTESAKITPSTTRLVSANTTNSTNAKASAGTLYGVSASNEGASVAFLKLYNKTTAPTVGTDQPVLIIPVPASNSVVLEYGAIGERFGTGISFAITAAMAYTDVTAVAANQVRVNLSYI